MLGFWKVFMDKEDLRNILVEDIDEEILERMPEWFKVLRKAYAKRFYEKNLL